MSESEPSICPAELSPEDTSLLAAQAKDKGKEFTHPSLDTTAIYPSRIISIKPEVVNDRITSKADLVRGALQFYATKHRRLANSSGLMKRILANHYPRPPDIHEGLDNLAETTSLWSAPCLTIKSGLLLAQEDTLMSREMIRHGWVAEIRAKMPGACRGTPRSTLSLHNFADFSQSPLFLHRVTEVSGIGQIKELWFQVDTINERIDYYGHSHLDSSSETTAMVQLVSLLGACHEELMD